MDIECTVDTSNRLEHTNATLGISTKQRLHTKMVSQRIWIGSGHQIFGGQAHSCKAMETQVNLAWRYTSSVISLAK